MLGEHRELHAIWAILTKGKKGYSSHPETKRWKGKLKALYIRHEKLVKEMQSRGYCHKSSISAKLAKGSATQNTYITPPSKQIKLLKSKKCGCRI